MIPECVHCGFRLPACPTYRSLGSEADSPRGRLDLMDALADGRLLPDASALRHLDLCLGCRACETACPSGVPYGQRLERARDELHDASARPAGERRLTRAVLAGMALSPALQAPGARILRGLGRVALWPPLGRRLPGSLVAGAELLARRPLRAARLPYLTRPAGRRRARVALLLGCVHRWAFGDVNAAAARLLAGAGCEVVVPPGQRCCGALHAHAGDRVGARALLRRNLDALAACGRLDAVVVNAAGCGSHLEHCGELLADDARYEAPARRLASLARDALELLDELGPPAPRRRLHHTVAYHDACHAVHGQGLAATPRRLLSALPGLSLVPLAEADRCCGSAGIYNLVHPEQAAALRDEKVAAVLASGADVLAAANPGCLLQIESGLRAAGSAVALRHPLQLLDEATRPDGP